MLATGRLGDTSRLLAAALLLLLATGAWWVAASPAEAATTHRVDVVGDDDGGFSPRTVTVEPGDTVRWVWVVADSRFLEFDDPSRNGGCVRVRSCEGEEHLVRFDEVGRFTYTDRLDGFTGTVVVETASSPTPSDTPTMPDPTPTVDPTSEPTPDPTSDPTSEPEPSPSEDTDSPTPAPAPSTSSPAPPPDPTPSRETADPVAVDTESAPPSPSPTEEDTAGATEESSPRPVPVPSFDSFPDAREPEPGDDVDGEVAIDADDGDRDRTLWGVVGGVTVLGTLGAFGRRVLFADPWDGAGDG